MTNCFSSTWILHLGQTFLFKKCIIPRKIIEYKIQANTHIYIVCPYSYKVSRNSAGSEELKWQIVSVVYLAYGQISKFKRGITSRKNLISGEYVNLHCMSIIITTRFHEILLSGFRAVALTKNRTDGLTNRWVKNISILHNSLHGV